LAGRLACLRASSHAGGLALQETPAQRNAASRAGRVWQTRLGVTSTGFVMCRGSGTSIRFTSMSPCPSCLRFRRSAIVDLKRATSVELSTLARPTLARGKVERRSRKAFVADEALGVGGNDMSVLLNHRPNMQPGFDLVRSYHGSRPAQLERSETGTALLFCEANGVSRRSADTSARTSP